MHHYIEIPQNPRPAEPPPMDSSCECPRAKVFNSELGRAFFEQRLCEFEKNREKDESMLTIGDQIARNPADVVMFDDGIGDFGEEGLHVHVAGGTRYLVLKFSRVRNHNGPFRK